jgi:hypothetical protein
MRSLTRKVAAVAIMVTASAPAAGQNQRGVIPAILIAPSATPVPSRPFVFAPAAVLDRIWSFDANGDDRIARDELPERMGGLIGRGDQNQDGVLSADEVVALVDTRPVARRTQGFIPRAPTSLADIIADLKLPRAMHGQAMEIVKTYTDWRTINDPVSDVVYAAMKEVLDDEDYENFVAAATRFRNPGRVFVDRGIVGGLVRPVSPRQ